MEGPIRKDPGIRSLNLDDLDVAELERRLEMAVALAEPACAAMSCHVYTACNCAELSSCAVFCGAD